MIVKRKVSVLYGQTWRQIRERPNTYVTISAARLSLCFSAAAFSSGMSMFPSSSVPTTTILYPTIAALAGFVPCAETGMMHTSRWWSPLEWW